MNNNNNTNLRNYTNRSRGVGDTIRKFTSATGLDVLANKTAAALGKKDCGCNKRQGILNKAFPYKK